LSDWVVDTNFVAIIQRRTFHWSSVAGTIVALVVDGVKICVIARGSGYRERIGASGNRMAKSSIITLVERLAHNRVLSDTDTRMALVSGGTLVVIRAESTISIGWVVAGSSARDALTDAVAGIKEGTGDWSTGTDTRLASIGLSTQIVIRASLSISRVGGRTGSSGWVANTNFVAFIQSSAVQRRTRDTDSS